MKKWLIVPVLLLAAMATAKNKKNIVDLCGEAKYWYTQYQINTLLCLGGNNGACVQAGIDAGIFDSLCNNACNGGHCAICSC